MLRKFDRHVSPFRPDADPEGAARRSSADRHRMVGRVVLCVFGGLDVRMSLGSWSNSVVVSVWIVSRITCLGTRRRLERRVAQ